jgi:shikimate kinase
VQDVPLRVTGRAGATGLRSTHRSHWLDTANSRLHISVRPLKCRPSGWHLAVGRGGRPGDRQLADEARLNIRRGDAMAVAFVAGPRASFLPPHGAHRPSHSLRPSRAPQSDGSGPTRLDLARRRRSAARVPDVRASAAEPSLSSLSLPSTELDAQIASRSAALCFVGMSNCGKSHWSGRLADDLGFGVLSVDEEIEKAIAPELSALGFCGIDGMAEWMGFPTDRQFRKNEAAYLAHEEALTSSAVAAPGPDGAVLANFVLDTTGSVVYLSPATLDAMRSRFLVIHLEASDDMLESMTDGFFLTPKPVVWGDCFNQHGGETTVEALRRCYPNLLAQRRARYNALAHLSIPASFALDRAVTPNQFLERIGEGLDSLEATEARQFIRGAGA